ncbi:unnamed protein product [Bursaphelenchus okinawaensis]|uniref:Glycosyl transferase family 25 domain-containing protein n=1 Tax=Bursaphelenchus okinawaensis TaxID=465554 RepID=A0A811LNA5_9BILA|nr:unnamed protein product [Bursaphelenchus okinawaensis]CAG9126062.1 unnamed protein product [Bursaphelenchus okinawaensis]
MRSITLLLLIVNVGYCFFGSTPDEGDYRHLYPELCIAYNVNFEEILSYSLGWLENLKYPKDRTKVLILTDVKDTINEWMSEYKSLYSYLTVETKDANYLEQSLKFGRRLKCSYLLLTTSDIFLAENSVRDLMALKQVVVSGLVKDPFSLHSNGKGLVDIVHLSGEKLEMLRVYYANSPLLINLKHKDASYLTFDEQNVRDNIEAKSPVEVFAYSAYNMDIPIFLDNSVFYGYIIDSRMTRIQLLQKLASFNYQMWINNNQVVYSNVIPPWQPVEHTYGFDKIYVINLKRRPERKKRIQKSLAMLGIEHDVFEAVDGMSLDEGTMKHVTILPGYLDPFHKRPLKKGEIGCFLSHYRIWKDIVDNGYERVIVFEDDIKFSENATTILREFMEDIIKRQTEWDFVYLGRKKNDAKNQEYYVPGHRYLSTVTYSYWTLGYALSRSGAQKLLDSKPLEKMIALDEYLPIMYDNHPNQEWKNHFPVRDLKAFTVYPLVVHPDKYLHEAGYLSDTENSTVISSNESHNTGALGLNLHHQAKSEL